jgi:hypothetical protein
MRQNKTYLIETGEEALDIETDMAEVLMNRMMEMYLTMIARTEDKRKFRRLF